MGHDSGRDSLAPTAWWAPGVSEMAEERQLATAAKKLGFEHDFVGVAPHPVFARLDGLNDGVFGFVEVFGGVLVLGGVAAADVAAFAAETKMDPSVTHFEAFFAALGVRANVLDVAQMRTALAHEASCFS
jgi:hypothetical protein